MSHGFGDKIEHAADQYGEQIGALAAVADYAHDSTVESPDPPDAAP